MHEAIIRIFHRLLSLSSQNYLAMEYRIFNISIGNEKLHISIFQRALEPSSDLWFRGIFDTYIVFQLVLSSWRFIDASIAS